MFLFNNQKPSIGRIESGSRCYKRRRNSRKLGTSYYFRISEYHGVSPQDIKVYHNTVWTLNTSGGIRLYNPNTAYQQYCYANAVFSPSPITNFTNTFDNITDDYNKASDYVLSATSNINSLDLYPKAGQLKGPLTTSTLFENNTNWSKDFNQDIFDWTYRGAYSGCCNNNGWKLQLDTISIPGIITSIQLLKPGSDIQIYPNPVSNTLNIKFNKTSTRLLELYSLSGQKLISTYISDSQFSMDLTSMNNGVYILVLKSDTEVFSRMIVKGVRSER